tara:strand:+ start:1289 stop:2206 length:918 start_codon:yes stop_codon:yes gene_type:complete
MKVVSYLQGIPRHNTNDQKTQLLKKFVQGVNKLGDIGIAHDSLSLVDTDVAVIQGWVYNDLTARHLQFRKQIIDKQKKDNKTLIIADANCFKFADPDNRRTYIKYSLNGIFPTTGNYCNSIIDNNRWQSIANILNLSIKPYIKDGSSILLLMQRSGGWSMKGVDNYTWFIDTIKKIRRYSDRHIVVRPHPGDKKARLYLDKISKDKQVKVSISQNKTLENDLKKTWAVVNHNSSATVGPIIYGYHCFLTDPTDSHSAEVSHRDFSYLENPQIFDRQQWIEKLSMCHWNFDELQSGACWKHMKKFI